MRPGVLVYTARLRRSVAWYQGLGFRLRRAHRHGGWVELEWGEALLWLHEAPAPPPPGFARPVFEAPAPLETLAERLRLQGLLGEACIVDEAYGRVLRLLDPDGREVWVVEHDPELYT